MRQRVPGGRCETESNRVGDVKTVSTGWEM